MFFKNWFKLLYHIILKILGIFHLSVDESSKLAHELLPENSSSSPGIQKTVGEVVEVGQQRRRLPNLECQLSNSVKTTGHWLIPSTWADTLSTSIFRIRSYQDPIQIQQKARRFFYNGAHHRVLSYRFSPSMSVWFIFFFDEDPLTFFIL